MTDHPDIRTHFDTLRTAVEPLDTASAAIDRAVQRRRRRPVVAGGALAAVATVTLAVALLPSLGPAASDATSLATSTAGTQEDPDPGESGYADFRPVTLDTATVGGWATAADVVVVLGTADDGASAAVDDVAWQRGVEPTSHTGTIDGETFELGADGALLLATAEGLPTTAALTPGNEYLAVLRWERVRCDGLAAGWVLLGDDTVLPYDDGVLRPGELDDTASDAPAATSIEDVALEDVAATMFAGHSADDVARTLDRLSTSGELVRAKGLCE